MGLVKIIHDGLGPSQVSEVDESSLRQWHQSGWRRLTEDDVAPAAPEPPPAAVPDVVKPAQTAKEEK